MSTSIATMSKSLVKIGAVLGALFLGAQTLTRAQLARAPQAVSSAVMRAARAGDDRRFATALAAEHVHLVLFLTTPLQLGSSRPLRLGASPEPETLPDAVRLFALNHPEVALDGSRAGILLGNMPLMHCVAPVLSQRLASWSFSGSFQDFQDAFDRMVHHIEDVAEGGAVGFKPPPDSPLYQTVNVTAQQTTALDLYLNALSQIDGVVIIFRNARDASGEMRCLRETYIRDVAITTSVGFERNPKLFPK